jgi:hypothetical protein
LADSIAEGVSIAYPYKMMPLSRKKGAGSPKLWIPRPFRILALDPGVTTGWAYCEYDPNLTNNPTLGDFHFESGHIGPGNHHLELWNHLVKIIQLDPNLPVLEIVCESFEFRQHINRDQAKTKVELMSKEYIGVVNLFCQIHGLTPHFQTASAAKTLIPDKGPQSNIKLVQLGLYRHVTHWPHAMDAMRHLLRYMVVDMRIREPITNHWL